DGGGGCGWCTSIRWGLAVAIWASASWGATSAPVPSTAMPARNSRRAIPPASLLMGLSSVASLPPPRRRAPKPHRGHQHVQRRTQPGTDERESDPDDVERQRELSLAVAPELAGEDRVPALSGGDRPLGD